MVSCPHPHTLFFFLLLTSCISQLASIYNKDNFVISGRCLVVCSDGTGGRKTSHKAEATTYLIVEKRINPR